MAINVCLVGAGRIGSIHAANLATLPAAGLAWVVDTDTAAAERLAERFGARAGGLEPALADPAVDAVIVASSTDTHLDLIEACCRAGKPVLCEKPLDLDVARARRSVARASQAQVPLFVGFNRRFDPSFRRVHDALTAGAVGELEVVTIISRDPAPPPVAYLRRSGGLFRDMTIHDLDMARWLLREEPVSVFATASCLVDPAIGDAGDVDSAAVVLRTGSGRLCQITNSRRCSYGYDQRLEVLGSAGMLRAGNHTATSVELATEAGVLGEPALPFFLERYRDAYRLELEDFVRAVAGEAHRLAGGDDGVRALLLAEAAERSSRAGAAVTPEWN